MSNEVATCDIIDALQNSNSPVQVKDLCRKFYKRYYTEDWQKMTAILQALIKEGKVKVRKWNILLNLKSLFPRLAKRTM